MESKSTFLIDSAVLMDSEPVPIQCRFLIPNPGYVEQIDSGHMTHLCGWRDEATSLLTSSSVCVDLCTSVYVHIVEYNTAMLNANQWI